MFNFLFKNALTKKSKIFLMVLTILISCSVGLLSINVSQQVDDGVIKLSDGYDVAIGPAGSDTQLAYNTLFFSEDALGTIDYSIYEKLSSDKRVGTAIPFAMADSFGNYRIVGTENEFLKNYSVKGELFDESCEAVIGYSVAQKANLKIGDTIFSTHGSMGSQHAQPITIVGILNKTNTNYDNVIFTQIETVWDLHASGHHEEEAEHKETEHKEEEHSDEHSDEKMLTSILLKTKSIQNQSEIVREYSKVHGIQAITPTVVLRKSLNNIDMSKQIVFALTTIIFFMSVILLFVITLLTSQDLKNDIKIMRYIGISKGKIFSIFLLQYAIINIFSLGLSFIVSHFILGFINNISTGYGIVINPSQIYNNEYIVLGIMFVVTLLPVLMYISKFFKKDITKI